MPDYKVAFSPLERTVTVAAGTTLLEAAGKARIQIDSACGGDGICGRCKMIVREGKVGGDVSGLLTREEIRRGVVLACQTTVEGDLSVEIPEQTRAKEKIVIDLDAQRFRAARPRTRKREFENSPIAAKVLLTVDPPSLQNNLDDYRRVELAAREATGLASLQTGLKIIRRMPGALRDGEFTITVTIGRRRGVGEVMDIEAGDTTDDNLMVVVDMGTTTIVAHLMNASSLQTLGAQACFNSQAMYGREVTARMIAAEKHGPECLQRLLIDDINGLISSLTVEYGVGLRDINAVVCAGNTAMMHFLLGLPTDHVRRSPFIAVTGEPPPFRAAEVGLKINPRGLLFAVPGIGAWVGGDLTAGILATGLRERDDVAMLIDIGTNGEIIIGNKDWVIACSASAGPALEGAGVESGMMAQQGAIEKVYVRGGEVRYDVIGGGKPDGICGSGIIDVIAVLLDVGVIDRAGKFVAGAPDPRLRLGDGRPRYVLADKKQTLTGREVAISQEDIDNVVLAKAAIFAAARIILERVDMSFTDLGELMIAGGFGSYINLDNAVAIGLLPDMPDGRSTYVGNTSIWGAKLAALSSEARKLMRRIVNETTYYDLMGSDDYVDQLKQAMFLPHTDIELFPSVSARRGARQRET